MEKGSRLLSLDVLRGFAIVGMILVNVGWSCGFCYTPLNHVSWNGFVPADLVFPTFMYVMGISIFISLKKKNFDWHCTLGRIIKRTILIIALGIALCWYWECLGKGTIVGFGEVRFPGVLQRLGVCYGIVAILALFINHKSFPYIVGGLLIGYLILQIAGNGFEKADSNIMAIADQSVFGLNHIYIHGKECVDPEGLLSTIPAVAQVMIGFLCGELIYNNTDNKDRIIKLFFWGILLLAAGFLLNFGEPINKKLWSSSFVMLTCGISSMMLAALTYVIDVNGYKGWCKFFQIAGLNPLTIYMLSEVLAPAFEKLHINKITFANFFQPIFGDYFGSFMYSATFCLLMWLIGYALYRKKIIIKL